MEPNDQPLIGKQILLIEDEYFIGQLYTRAFTKAGASVKLIITGDEGLTEAKNTGYDYILLDLMLPNMNGIEVLKEIKNTHINPTTKIVFITNTQQPDGVRAEIEKSVDGYFIKAEITPKQLVAHLVAIK